MGATARSLQRDPQLESVPAIRKAELGVSMQMGRSVGQELAMSRGTNYVIGRELGS